MSFAKALVLIDIIEETNLPVKTALPVALSLVDPKISAVNAHASSIKRACQRRFKSGYDLHDRIDTLYSNDHDDLGHYCSKLGVDKSWLNDHHQEALPRDAVVTNGAILEIYRYHKKHGDSNWLDAQRWLSRLFPDRDRVHPKNISKNWKRLQAKKNSKLFKANKAFREALMMEEYQFPKPHPITTGQCRRSTLDQENENPMNSDQEIENPMNSSEDEVDIFHKVYDSPTKRKLVDRIREQELELERMMNEMETSRTQFVDLRAQYVNLLSENTGLVKDRSKLRRELESLEDREKELVDKIKNLTKAYNPECVRKKLKYRENKIVELKGFVESYKEALAIEREQMLKEKQRVSNLKHIKRKGEKKMCYYKTKVRPLEEMKDQEIKALLKESDKLRYEVDDLQSQLEDCLKDKFVTTFHDGKYVNAIRLICYDFLARNVGTQHISELIRSVLENLAGVKVDRLPKASLVKIMALEADILAKKQVAKALLSSPNATIHMDATTKKQRHFWGVQITTDSGSFSGGLSETVGGDTTTQLDVTKDFFKELAEALDLPQTNPDSEILEHKLLFNIRNSMTDRGPTSRGWVEGLEIWREEILRNNVLPNYQSLSPESITKIAKINDFYCGKHFLLGLADRVKVGLNLWEEEISDFTGPVGMEELEQFSRWKCEKPAGLRLVRTACELVGKGAKMPHGIPSTFESYLQEGERNHCPSFEHNRFNVVFSASSAVYHHRLTILKVLQDIDSDNKLHKAVSADIQSVITCAEIQALAMLEKHMTTPLQTITSRKEHILDLRQYYIRLKEFLEEMIADPTPIIDGSAVLFTDCPPIKDTIWDSIYEPVEAEQESLVEQLISILCASFLVVVQRQLFDFLHGKWADIQNDLRDESAAVPRNNDISERDFSGLDRLIRTKISANIDFMSGLLLYTNNKTAQSLHSMNEEELSAALSSATKLARKKRQHSKAKKLELRQQRYAKIQEKKAKKAEKDLKRIKAKQKAQDEIIADGQCKDVNDLRNIKEKYSGKELTLALKRQFAFYKSLNIPGVAASKFHLTSKGKQLPVDILELNLEHIIEKWKIAMQTATEGSTAPSTQTIIQDRQSRVSSLKRRLVHEADTEWERKCRCQGSAPKKKKKEFPGDEIVGNRIKHKFKIKLSSGKVKYQWFKGTVRRKATQEELEEAAAKDMEYIEKGYTLYFVDYDKAGESEPVVLQADWENGDIQLISNE